MLILLIVGLVLIGACAALVGRAVAHAAACARSSASTRSPPMASTRQAGVADAGRRADRWPEHASPCAWARWSAGIRPRLSQAELRRELISAGLYRVTPLTLVGYRVLAAIALPARALWLATAARL